MKTVAGGIILAVLLFVVGVAARNEARVIRSVADAHRRLATLHYDEEDGITIETTMWQRVPLPIPSTSDDVKRHRATVSYWLQRYDELAGIANSTSAQASQDPALLFVAANAAFRTSGALQIDRKIAVERLDGIVQQYADVLRKDPTIADASYNYEFVARMRDAIAKTPPGRQLPLVRGAAKPDLVSIDLPTGATVHGRPGGPPEDIPMSDFKTVTPMSYEEREEQMDPGRGGKIQRKG